MPLEIAIRTCHLTLNQALLEKSVHSEIYPRHRDPINTLSNPPSEIQHLILNFFILGESFMHIQVHSYATSVYFWQLGIKNHKSQPILQQKMANLHTKITHRAHHSTTMRHSQKCFLSCTCLNQKAKSFRTLPIWAWQSLKVWKNALKK